MINLSLEQIIHQVYGLPSPGFEHGPDWLFELRGSRFNIEARTADHADRDQLMLMAQQLLVSRFKLKTHRETVPGTGLALIVGEDGPKLRVAQNTGAPRGAGRIEYIVGSNFIETVRGNNVSLAALADFLSRHGLAEPVIDKTNFTDPIDFTLQFEQGDTPHHGGQTLETALEEQLGLHVVKQNLPIEVLFIDYAEKPSTN